MDQARAKLADCEAEDGGGKHRVRHQPEACSVVLVVRESEAEAEHDAGVEDGACGGETFGWQAAMDAMAVHASGRHADGDSCENKYMREVSRLAHIGRRDNHDDRGHKHDK